MRTGAKMLMISDRGSNRDRDRDYGRNTRNEYDGARSEYGGSGGRSAYDGHEYSRMEMNGAEMNWEPDSRFRDRRGREHYDSGRYAPRSSMDEPMDNYGPDSRGYSRREDGRFAPKNEGNMRKNYGGESHYPFGPVPPVYERGGDMNRIGFAMPDSSREVGENYRSDAAYSHMNEMEHKTSASMMGGARGGEMMLTEEMAHEWMHGLQNEDGTKGPHWTMDQVKQVMSQRGVQADPLKMWVAMNAEYSDRCEVNKKHGVNKIDFYFDSALAFWLKDKDAVDDKEAAYFMYVVK